MNTTMSPVYRRHHGYWCRRTITPWDYTFNVLHYRTYMVQDCSHVSFKPVGSFGSTYVCWIMAWLSSSGRSTLWVHYASRT